MRHGGHHGGYGADDAWIVGALALLPAQELRQRLERAGQELSGTETEPVIVIHLDPEEEQSED